MNLNEEELSRTRVYDGGFISVDEETVKLPDGRTASREIVRHPGAVCCLAINENNEALFVRQWREPIKSESIEIPAGKLESDDVSTLHAMKRELNEETKFTAEFWDLVYTFYSTPGFSDEKMYLYYCDGLKEATDKLSLDDDEFLEPMFLTLDQAKKMIETGQISDAKTILAINYWAGLKVNNHE